MNSKLKKILIVTTAVITTTAGVGAAIIFPLQYVYKDRRKVETNNNSSHYFVIMMDSMASYKMESALKQEHLEDEFKGWDLKMNVLSPGYGTETGLAGIIGGPKRTPLIGQFLGKTPSEVYNDAYDTMVADLSTADIKHIYMSNPEYYKTSGTDFEGSETIRDPKKLVRYISSYKNGNLGPNSLKVLASQVKENENNFSFFISDIGHTDTYNKAYYNKSGGGIVNQLLNFKRELVKRKMYDNSYILVVSDHGRPPVHESDYTGKYINKLRAKTYNNYVNYNADKSAGRIDSISHPTFLPKEVKTYTDMITGGGEAVAASMNSIFYKPRRQKNTHITYDDTNLFANYDVQSIIHHDLNIDDKNITFDMNDYMPSGYTGSSYNSYVKDPLHADLSNRKLFVANKNTSYGLWHDLHFGKQISLFNKPFFSQNGTIEKYILDNKTWNWAETPYLQEQSNIALKTDKLGGLKTLGKMLYALESNKKIHV